MSDTSVQKTASLDEKTVQKVARGEVDVPRRRRRKRAMPEPPVTHIRVDRQLWEEAVLAAYTRDLDERCIDIVDERTVYVFNSPEIANVMRSARKALGET